VQAGAFGDEQTIGTPVHAPAVQVSSIVQGLPSSHWAPSMKSYAQAPWTHLPIKDEQSLGGVLQGPQELVPPVPPPPPAALPGRRARLELAARPAV
jgi:hypothetical protein